MAIGFWLLTALGILSSALALITTSVGYRVVLLACVLIGLTPVGFMAGSSLPVYLPELLLVALSVGVLVQCEGSISSVALPKFFFIFVSFFLYQIVASILIGEVHLFDLIRNIRPLAFVGLLLLVREILRQVSVGHVVTERSIAMVIVACVGVDAVFYAATEYGLLEAGGISGELYSRTGIIRYADLLTITLFGVANYLSFASERTIKGLFWLGLCGIIAALSLNRIFAIGFLIALSWWLYTSVRRWTKVPGVPMLAATSPIAVLVLAGIAYTRSLPMAGELASRVTELFDISLLISALEYRFVEPALTGGYQLTPYTFFFGQGMGLKFYVPWFEYRGIDPWHFSVDSLFAFAFFKYGLIGLSILLYGIAKFLWNRPWNIANAWVWLYLLVHSGINVPGFLLFVIVLTVLRDASWLVVWSPPVRDGQFANSYSQVEILSVATKH